MIIAIHSSVLFVFSAATLPADDSLVQNVSSTETYLYLDWATLLKPLKVKGSHFNHRLQQTPLCKTLAKANAVQLRGTPRLMNQVGSFAHKLKLCFNRKMDETKSNKQQCIEQMEKSPPWACKVLESEFYGCSNRFQQICKKNLKRGPHPKWTEFKNDVDFDVAFMQAASIEGKDIYRLSQ